MPTVTRDEMLEPLAAPLRDLVTWLSGGRIPFVIIGGVAASLQGEARFTGDIDAVVMTDESKLEEFLKDAKLHGFSPRRADPIGFARANRIVLLVHDADAMNVDLSLGILPFEQEMIERAVRVSELGMEIPIAAPEELIAMKVLAFRGRDITDIEGLLDANPGIDMARVWRWVHGLAEGLESPEIADRLKLLLAKREERGSTRNKSDA